MYKDPFPLGVGYFRLARNVSRLSDHKVKVGAVLAKKVPLMACSNKINSHPLWANDTDIRGSIHAEVRAIINCQTEDLNGSVAYVYRETRAGKPALARPCKYCMDLLREKGIKKIFYTIDEFPYYNWERI